MKLQKILYPLIGLALALGACAPASIAATSQTIEKNAAPAAALIAIRPPESGAASQPTSTSLPAASPTSTTQPAPTQTSQPAAPAVPATASDAPVSIGPDPQNIPSGYNPLTGLPVDNPDLLKLPAVLISITNFPPSARPQAGLSFSPWVFELYIAEGMTRYLATFYGAFPKIGLSTDPAAAPLPATVAQVGPVRSGRLPYVYVRDFFQNSCLVYAGATVEIRDRLKGCGFVFGSDAGNINSAMLDVTRLEKIAQTNQRSYDQFNYSGNLFTSAPQVQGAPASLINVYYSLFNQAQWQYSPDARQYLKFDDFANGNGKFTPATDRLNGNQLSFSNVVVLYTKHTVISPYIIDIQMAQGERGKAVIFRDGQVYNAFWSTMAGSYEKSTMLRRPLRFENADGSPFALKPGQTWIHIVTLPSEVLDKGAGNWFVQFYAPLGAK